jgi:LPS export ABC transporter permease LptF/LPS export ABC transporter permease LptG
MRILTRYILREVSSHALIGLAVFTFVLFTRDLGHILELIIRNSAPLPAVAQIFFFSLPATLTYTIPMAVLVGILIGYSRLAADSEITAMRASGIGVWSFLSITSIFVAVAFLLALFNGSYLVPRSQAALSGLQETLKSSQVSFEVQPRVFHESFPRLVLYVQDVKGAQRAAIWKGVFIADTTNPSAPRITLAQQGVLVSEGPHTLQLHLTNGSMHEVDLASPDHYQVSTFEQTDRPIELPQQDIAREQEPAPLAQLSTRDLLVEARTKQNPALSRWYYIELHRRFALPAACIVLGLVGVPLGLSSKKGGKSSGFVLTILLVFAYYFVSLLGVSLARQGKVPPGAGVWLADFAFLICGAVLLWRVERRPFEIGPLRIWNRLTAKTPLEDRRKTARSNGTPVFQRVASRYRFFNARFPMILDDYVLRDFFVNLALIIATFIMLLLVFTLFELLGDILRNQISPIIVGEYLWSVTPYFLYTTTHYGILLAVLITLGWMHRSNEITAMKATGISIYRIIVPVLIASALLAGGLFSFDQFYLPRANKRQDALRNRIKGKPPQTYLNPDRKWIFGQHSTIYYYQVFDPELSQFGSLSVFQFDPKTFQLTDRIYASRAQWDASLQRWVCTQGWERSFHGSAIDTYRTFDVSTFAAISEPPSYFQKEVRQSSEMNYQELRRYIHDLQQSGFDVVRLRVQLQKKLAFPIITLVMAVLAVPFALSGGKRGTVAGVAVAVGIAVVYSVTSSMFESMGNISQLPPALAAWSPDLIFALLGGYLILRVPT